MIQAANYAASTSQEKDVKPYSELEYLANQLDCVIEETGGLAGRLIEALRPVIKPAPPSEDKACGGQVGEALSPIGQRHRSQAEKLESINSHLRILLKNLAV